MLDRVSVKAIMTTVNRLVPGAIVVFPLPGLFSSWFQNSFALIFKVEKMFFGLGLGLLVAGSLLAIAEMSCI